MARTMQVDKMSGGGKSSGQQTPLKVQQVQVSSTTSPEEQAKKKPNGYKGTESWDPTWEPKESLKVDGLGYAMLMVDAWMLAGRPDDFLQWARRTIPTLIGANASGTCMFNALQQAVFRAFLAQLKRAGSRISLKDLEYNWQRTGHRGIAGIKRLKLEDGFYIVAASNSMGVRHAFVVEVQGHKYTAHDESVKSSLEQYGEWINSLMFVRKVALEA
ncbi:hypothetical protein F441_22088 [Phytophthora nicotianae CJ01A1]|uniref:Uncharacterized protein n=2 Tax=Phytophthora nicotianae TaxID=4792 RepID=W2VT51_PHYNI|nr:hypothetical protein L916_21597 [Phytophthora nicotianae]ETP00539.1 hypothetical protein F441_22088 [Phytophthora nicotianae CJ01A1]